MTYGEVLCELKNGRRATRVGWNGKDMWIILVPGRILNSIEPNSFYDKCGFLAGTKILPHIDMKTGNGDMCVGWTASQADQLSTDWYILIDIH
jgi:hypothetical protein